MCADAPIRLLGTHDNVGLSLANRDRMTDPGQQKELHGS
jgi:hypothetical protein